MPTYGYRCTECKNEFERVQKMSDPPVTECPLCGKPVKKILYPVGISFKGEGFYVNDSKKSDKPKATASGDTAKGEGEGSKTDAKPETKHDAKTDGGTTTPAPATPTPAAASSSDAKYHQGFVWTVF